MRSFTCEEARRWLARLREHGDDLPAGLHFHLTACDECRGLAERYQAGVSALRRATAQLPAELPAFRDVLAGVQDRRPEARRRIAPVRLAWGFAAAAAAVAIALVALLPSGEPLDVRGAVAEALEAPRRPGLTVSPSGDVRFGGGARLHQGQAIETGPDGVVTLAEAGTATLTLRSESRLELPVWTPRRSEIRLVRGSVRAKVAPRGERDRFRVHTAVALVEVVGTEFVVDVLPDGRTWVHVREGVVRVSELRSGRIHQLKAGESVTVPAGPIHATSADPKDEAKAAPVAPGEGVEAAPDKEGGLAEGDAVTAEAAAPEPKATREEPEQPRRRPRTAAKKPEPRRLDVPELIVAAREALAEGRDDDALKLLARARSTGRYAAQVWALSGDAHRLAKRHEEALRCYERAAELGSGTVQAAALEDAATLLATRLWRPTAAADTWRRYLKVAPTGRAAPRAHLYLAEAGDDTEKRLRHIMDGFPQSPEAGRAMVRLGKRLLDRGRPGEAARVFSGHLDAQDRRTREAATVGLMRARLAQGHTAALRQLLQRYEREFPRGKRRDEVAKIRAAVDGGAR